MCRSLTTSKHRAMANLQVSAGQRHVLEWTDELKEMCLFSALYKHGYPFGYDHPTPLLLENNKKQRLECQI